MPRTLWQRSVPQRSWRLGPWNGLLIRPARIRVRNVAGTVTRFVVHQLGDTTLTGAYTFAYGDEFDGTDWDTSTIPEGPFDLTGDMVVTVTGPGTVFAGIYRWIGQSPNLWRSGTFTAGNTPQSFPTGTGPNPRQVQDLARTEVARSDGGG